jgi:hypothetical protein
VPTYVLQDPANSKRLIVASEAPIVDWFPLATIFLHGLIEMLSPARATSKQDQRAKSDELRHAIRYMGGFISLTARLATTMDDFRYSAAASEMLESLVGNDANLDSYNATRIAPIPLHKLFWTDNAGADQEDVQFLALLIERIAACLGRTLENDLRSGWAYLAPPTDAVHVLLINTLHFHSTISRNVAGPALVEAVYSTASGTGTTKQNVDLSMEGTQTVKFHTAVNMAELVVDSGGFAVIHITISFPDESQNVVAYTGRLHLKRASSSVIMLAHSGKQHESNLQDFMTTLTCKLILVSRWAVALEERWHKNRHACMVEYAYKVGAKFGKTLVLDSISFGLM